MITGEGKRHNKPSLPHPTAVLKKFKVYKGLTICSKCGSSHFTKFCRSGTHEFFFCIQLTCEQCGLRSRIVLDERDCLECESRIDCLSSEIESVTTDILCQLI
jgi:hypothetical protein